MAEQAGLEWHVVRTKPHQEQSVELNLSRAGIEVFCPRIREEKYIRRKVQSVVAPLFPSYLFVRFCLSQSRTVMYATGVRRLVSFGHTPAIVQDEIIDGIRDRLQDGVVNLKVPSFSRGDVVRIREGPLCGLEAVFEQEMIGKQRVMLLMKTLTCQVRVILDLKSVVNL
jgi:transcriptional antiterminator RfaH